MLQAETDRNCTWRTGILTALLVLSCALTSCGDEPRDWSQAHVQDTPRAYQVYLHRHPHGPHAPEAREALTRVEEAAAWSRVVQEQSLSAVRAYRATYPEGDHLFESSTLLYVTAALAHRSAEGLDRKVLAYVVHTGQVPPNYTARDRERLMHAFEDAVRSLSPEERFAIPLPLGIRNTSSPVGPGRITLTAGSFPGGVRYHTDLPSEALPPANGTRIDPRPFQTDGAVIRVKGRLVLETGHVLTGDYKNPLCFIVLRGSGLTWFMGVGTVSTPDGTVWHLPEDLHIS